MNSSREIDEREHSPKRNWKNAIKVSTNLIKSETVRNIDWYMLIKELHTCNQKQFAELTFEKCLEEDVLAALVN